MQHHPWCFFSTASFSAVGNQIYIYICVCVCVCVSGFVMFATLYVTPFRFVVRVVENVQHGLTNA